MLNNIQYQGTQSNLELAVIIAHSTNYSGPNNTLHRPPGTTHSKALNAHNIFWFYSALK